MVYCLNRGVSGETSGELLRHIYTDSKSCPQAKTALLLTGSNDTWLPQKIDIYQDNLRQIINVLKEKHENIGLGFLPPIIGPGLPNYPFNAKEQVNSINKVIALTARKYNCFLADFRRLEKYIVDTVHFSHIGYHKMAEIWYQAIEKRGIL